MTQVSLCAVALLFSTSSAFAQIDASALRSKYGAPVDRETFTVRPGIEMVVDYGPNKQICRIHLPPVMQREVNGTWEPRPLKQQIDEVLGEVAPPSMRGTEIDWTMTATPKTSISFGEFQHVTIYSQATATESNTGAIGDGITVDLQRRSLPEAEGSIGVDLSLPRRCRN